MPAINNADGYVYAEQNGVGYIEGRINGFDVAAMQIVSSDVHRGTSDCAHPVLARVDGEADRPACACGGILFPFCARRISILDPQVVEEFLYDSCGTSEQRYRTDDHARSEKRHLFG